MANRVINLNGDKRVVENEEANYSKLLLELIQNFRGDFSDEFIFKEIVEFAISAWNFANISEIVPEKDFSSILTDAPQNDEDLDLLKRMVDYKNAQFKEFDLFIAKPELDFENNETILSVVIRTRDEYMTTLLDEFQGEFNDMESKPGFLNRIALVVTPKKPFLDWVNEREPKDKLKLADIESNSYLINEETNIEKWLKKYFDTLFRIELDGWNSNMDNWPKNRNYSMFKKWFKTKVSLMIYDLEEAPLFKE